MNKQVLVSQKTAAMLDSIRAARHCSYDEAISMLCRTGKVNAGVAWEEAANDGIDALREVAARDPDVCRILEDIRVALIRLYDCIPDRALKAAAAFRAAIEAAQLR